MPDDKTPDDNSGEAFIEYLRVGKSSVRVTAIDAETGTEVVFQAPVSAGKAAMKKVALKKLRYVLKKQKGSGVGG